MKTQVFVLVPYDVSPSEIGDFERLLLERHRFDPDEPGNRGRGRYDYLVGALRKSFKDPVAEGRLPPKVRRSYAGNICERKNLPHEIVPAALVTPDGEWHDVDDYGWHTWETRYRELVATHQNCWVVEVWAHS